MLSLLYCTVCVVAGGYSVGSGGRTENSLDLDGFDVLRFRSKFLLVYRVPSLTLHHHIIYSRL